MNLANVRQWLQRGDLEKLENVVLEGRGARLLGEHSPDLRTRVFLKGLPNYLTKISQVHDAVTRGSLAETQRIISEEPKKKLALSKDPSGTPLVHKAVYHDHQDIVQWLIEQYPEVTRQRDREGRSALHYCAACGDPDSAWDVLVEGGCDSSICDKKGNPAAYYLENSSEIELPESERMPQRRKPGGKEALDFKPSNIRIWIHNRDIGKLQQVLWEGHGGKLRCETSNNPRVRKFLEAVPFIMGTIKDIHGAAIGNDVQKFQEKIADPVSPVILGSKDSNGLTALHKAAGLGHTEIAQIIIDKYPAGMNVQDNEGRTPLHYAAAAKDGGVVYNLLVQNGADDSKLDNKQKAAAFYKNRPSDVDGSNLTVLPEAPRVHGNTYPKGWDWRILEAEGIAARVPKRSPKRSPDGAFGAAGISEVTPEEDQREDSGGREDFKDDLVEQIKRADEELTREVEREEEHSEEPEPEPEATPERTSEVDGREDEAETEEPEEPSTDDDVVLGTGPTNHEENPEEPGNQGEEDEKSEATRDPQDPEWTEVDQEVPDPGTGDSGVDVPAQDEDQVIEGEHEELAEAELNEGSMSADPEVQDLLENGSMEQLAALVLNGEGRRLVGRQSGNPELQAFIDNVPSYMGKIHAVHMAAREGNLRDLQSALDRRKFAIARDGSSPHGATPLHVAVVFGRTSVVRYLAGRFPETTHAVDLDGRTPLHYAATLADNGHYYNLLIRLGANPLVQDNFEHTAEFYQRDHEDLSHRKLLRDFGASEKLAEEMLTDKVPGGDAVSARRDVDEAETLATLERCFRLLGSTRRGAARAPGTPGTPLGRLLTRPVFDGIKHRVTRMDHNLFDVIWPALRRWGGAGSGGSAESLGSGGPGEDTFPGGPVVAPDFESYFVFQELFDPLLRELHLLTATGDLPDQPEPLFVAEGPGPPDNLDPGGRHVLAGAVECSRNLEAFCLPPGLTESQLEEVERYMRSRLAGPEFEIAAGGRGVYHPLREILELGMEASELGARLAAAGLALPLEELTGPDSRRLHGPHWPRGRGVFVFGEGRMAVWINVREHLRIVCATDRAHPGRLVEAFRTLERALEVLGRGAPFRWDRKLGFLGSRPVALGNTLRFLLLVRLPRLSRDGKSFAHLCAARGLWARPSPRRTDTLEVGNLQCLSLTEAQTLGDFSRALLNVLALEREAALGNPLQIANLLARVVRKRLPNSRRSSRVE